MIRQGRLALVMIVIGCVTVHASAEFPYRQYADRDAAFFRSAEARELARNVLSHQSPLGGWPKNINTGESRYAGDPEDITPTFDNDATFGEMRFLATMYSHTADDAYRAAFKRALAYILDAQYPTGGWPQRYPPPSSYHRHITFNDHAMVNILRLLREMLESDDYAFLDDDARTRLRQAYDRGIACILDTQIEVNGKLTAWCQQHDPETLEPRGGRSYEHASISGGESAGVLLFLMDLPDPDERVQRAVHAGIEWYQTSAIYGMRVERRDNDRVVVEDPEAPPLWARFYDIETNRPIFSGRDGIIREHLHEIERERRTGYAWYVNSGRRALSRFEDWKRDNSR
ncbi:MAG: pectate lyase [Phycisphaeraceae bacterium]